MKDLKLSEDIKLPPDIVTDTIGVLAIKGSGKTYTFLVLCEEMIKRSLPVVILDTMGVCWGLRSSADGKQPGLPVVILGGSHRDVPLEFTAGKVIADWIIAERQPAILDISEFSKGEALRFVLEFMTRLFQLNRDPLHLVIDEADEWAPQKPFREEARTLRAMELFVRRGRARGLGVTLVTQRPATLNKNVLTQVSTLIVGRMIAPQDRKAVQLWVDAHGTERQKEAFWDSLAALSTKEKWIWSPPRGIFMRTRIRTRETFDSSATPKVGERIATPKSIAEVDLEALTKKISATIEKAKQDDPRELHRQIAELKAKTQFVSVAPPAVKKTVEVPMLKPGEISSLKIIFDRFLKANDRLEKLSSNLSDRLRAIQDVVEKFINKPVKPIQNVSPLKLNIISPIRKILPSTDVNKDADSNIRLRLGERRMLEVLVRWYPTILTKSQLATLSRLRVSGGTFGAYYGILKRVGYIIETAQGVTVTEAGLQMCGELRGIPQTTEEVIEMWRKSLRLGERKLLDFLIGLYPNSISKEDLALNTNLTSNAGTFGAYLGTLRRNGLAEVDHGMIRAGYALFMNSGQ